ncbi:LysR family transcriptional regulator [Megasphaera elsdenii]|uniref:LysR family transcriptional regulator n=1 Tax=Megasphaera elsdenii TaxID=907 RepID=UPI003F80EEE7
MDKGERMTIQFLRYIVSVAEIGSITETAKQLHISQPSLSAALKEAEKEVGFEIFTRSRSGIALTKEGVEFLGYARQVIQEMSLLEDRFILNQPEKQRFCVSTQHYTFTANAFVEMVQKFGRERFEFILNETQTHQILEDVKNRFCDLGIIYLCHRNEPFLRKTMDEMGLSFHELFTVSPHVFLRAKHPLAGKESVTLKDLQAYPRLNFLQGNYESADFSEEPFSTELSEKEIRVSDRAAIVNLMIGLDGYTISSGIFPKYLQGRQIISVPLAEKEVMHIGYVLCKEQSLSELGGIYVEALKKYAT